jgi:hypothetical protein
MKKKALKDWGTSISGGGGTSISGAGGTIIIKYFDWGGKRCRFKVGYIGEDGLKPNTPYVLDENHNFIEQPRNYWAAGVLRN